MYDSRTAGLFFSFFPPSEARPSETPPALPTSGAGRISIMLTADWTDELKKNTDVYKSCVHMYTTSERIPLESPGCTGSEAYLGSFKTLASGTF